MGYPIASGYIPMQSLNCLPPGTGKVKKEIVHQMKLKRLISSILALALVLSVSVSAFADTWYMEDGNIIVSANENGQTVQQGSADAVPDSAPVITQRDSSTATDNTVSISTSGGATAEVTIKDINISSTGDAIDVGSSDANITLEGENKIFSESGSALHVSDGDVTITGSGSLEAEIGGDAENYVNNNNAKIGSHVDENMSGKIHITGSATVTTKDDGGDVFFGEGAGIGSGGGGNMSGDIIIDENATVTAFSQEEGAGIGSGYNGDMSGDITISDSAKVTAVSDDGAGIGSGKVGKMSGDITIGGSAQVTAWSEEEGAGIGAGEDGSVSGTITIGGSAQVIAGSNDDSAGIGAGEYGSITSTGRIIIRDNAKVTAIGEEEGAGIGSGEDLPMEGLIIIQDNAQVTAIAGNSAAAIGSNDGDKMTGIILILGNARITTGMEMGVDFDYSTKQIKYTLDENHIGYIGDVCFNNHASSEGHYVLGPDVTINGLRGSNIEALKQYINMRLSGENHDGEPENLTTLDIRSENGGFTVTASGEGTVEKILYGGKEAVPTAPGSYTVTVILKLNSEPVELKIGTLVVPEPKPEATTAPKAETAVSAPLYRVTDKDGKDLAYKAERNDGVLTVTVDADFAALTGKLGGIGTLMQQGIEKLVFVTNEGTSAFNTAELLEKGNAGDTYKLTHNGETVTFVLGENATDVSGILIKA